jgi:two-component system sensor histidine kinase DesK
MDVRVGPASAKLLPVTEAHRAASPAPSDDWPRGAWMRGTSPDELVDGHNRWGLGPRRLIFPAIFLVYLLQTASGVSKHSHGAWAVVGYAVLVVFSGCYLTSMPAVWTGNDRRFWFLYSAMVGLTAVELVLAHEDAFVMCIYIAIVGIALGARWALPAAGVYTLLALFLPPVIGSWHADFDPSNAASLALVSLAMWAFFGIIRTNHALDEARAQVATLAAEGERNRIARDLHDLLGHSLTTITVKAGLARRLADQDPARAAVEIGEVEELARRSLADVRAAVSNYRVVTLTNELATAQEVLRATGIDARVLTPTDVVDPELQELFGWVVREGTTNVVRHSRAERCTITFGARSIEIRDDGVGGSAGITGNGITGLRERIAAAGGTLEAGRAPGGGWRIAVEVP